MTWRGSATSLDRLFACLPYLMPLVYGSTFGAPLFQEFPALQIILLPIAPLLLIYSIPFASLIIFFALYLLVVRNEKVPHFIRFNTMQAILLDIILVLCNIILNLALEPALGRGNLLIDTLSNAIFLGTIAAVVYSVVQTALGRYAEIPTLSEAVHMQVR